MTNIRRAKLIHPHINERKKKRVKQIRVELGIKGTLRKHFDISSILKNKKILYISFDRFGDILCILVSYVSQLKLILMQMLKWWRILLLPAQCLYYSLRGNMSVEIFL